RNETRGGREDQKKPRAGESEGRRAPERHRSAAEQHEKADRLRHRVAPVRHEFPAVVENERGGPEGELEVTHERVSLRREIRERRDAFPKADAARVEWRTERQPRDYQPGCG